MTLSLNKQVCEQQGLSIDEALLLLVLNSKVDLEQATQDLVKKGYITSFGGEGTWRMTNKGSTVLDAVLIESDRHQEPEELLNNLAERLKEVFPKGKKEGTNYYWADGKALIVRRLKLFFKKYGNQFTEDQIIGAATKYVEGFNGNYIYMRLLKYFIFKEKIGAAGEIEGDSELMTYIENAGQEENLRNDWTSSIN